MKSLAYMDWRMCSPVKFLPNNIYEINLLISRRSMHPDLYEGPLDLKAGEKYDRKGPPVSHSLPIYKTTHKLNHGVRWKKANLITNVSGGKDYRLSETQGEGQIDQTGIYRDWLYGDERRYANYIGCFFGLIAVLLFVYTINMMSKETWDIPEPVLASQRKRSARVGLMENNTSFNKNGEVEDSNLIRDDQLDLIHQKPEVIPKFH